MSTRELATKVAWHYLGTPYIWGGDDPTGFDCSGFVIEILKSVGILPRDGDWTAAGLFLKYPAIDWPREGCLVFWESNGRITHVEYCLDDKYSIGASGGWSETDTPEEASKVNAYIKIRPFRTRPGVCKFTDPFTA